MTVQDVADHFHELTSENLEQFGEMCAVAERFQRASNPIYAAFGSFRYLPVDAFKHAPVCTFDPANAEACFLSSGTGTGARSRHYVKNLDLYNRSITTHFEHLFGAGPFTFLAHLPEYSELGQESSLVYMAQRLIDAFGDCASGFFLDDLEPLRQGIRHAAGSGNQFVLFGAAFGLLDLLEEEGSVRLPEGAVVLETGGMKTHRRAVSREELHSRLALGFHVEASAVRSEYGMCELLSQCYTGSNGVFRAPPWMSVEVVDPMNPSSELPEGREGVLAVFDLANIYSVSGVLTQDKAVGTGDGFRVLGRMSTAELRGCNFLFEDAP